MTSPIHALRKRHRASCVEAIRLFLAAVASTPKANSRLGPLGEAELVEDLARDGRVDLWLDSDRGMLSLVDRGRGSLGQVCRDGVEVHVELFVVTAITETASATALHDGQAARLHQHDFTCVGEGLHTSPAWLAHDSCWVCHCPSWEQGVARSLDALQIMPVPLPMSEAWQKATWRPMISLPDGNWQRPMHEQGAWRLVESQRGVVAAAWPSGHWYAWCDGRLLGKGQVRSPAAARQACRRRLRTARRSRTSEPVVRRTELTMGALW